MSVYILVHGADCSGELWKKVVPLLEKQDHHVYCPSMSKPENSSLNKDFHFLNPRFVNDFDAES